MIQTHGRLTENPLTSELPTPWLRDKDARALTLQDLAHALTLQDLAHALTLQDLAAQRQFPGRSRKEAELAGTACYRCA